MNVFNQSTNHSVSAQLANVIGITVTTRTDSEPLNTYPNPTTLQLGHHCICEGD